MSRILLRHLTDADLEKIWAWSSLGHRRKILAAIAELPELHLRQNEVLSTSADELASSRNPNMLPSAAKSR